LGNNYQVIVKKIIVSFLIVSFFISGCAHSYSIDSKETKLQFYDRVNKLCAGHQGLILKTKDERKIRVNSFTLSPDSTLYSEFELGTAEYINTAELSQIEFYNYSKLGRTLLGMGFGAVAAFPTILLFTISDRDKTGLEWLLFIIPGLGALVGLAIGTSSGPDIIKL
jgi:hypothetical protein